MKKDLPGSSLSRSPVHLLHRASQRAADHFTGIMGQTELTPRQYAVLLTVAEHEGLSQTALVSITGIDRSTLADIVRRMLRKGILQRQRTRHDARTYEIRLTDRGAELLAAAQPVAREVDRQLLSELSVSERETLIEILTRIVVSQDSDSGPADQKRGRDANRAAAA
ncbi:MAG: MarR family transcriptional regulator [Rhizobiales bacterium]|nr:MarR family transcriptional regulator [Hyphomicrobiales bacterium]